MPSNINAVLSRSLAVLVLSMLTADARAAGQGSSHARQTADPPTRAEMLRVTRLAGATTGPVSAIDLRYTGGEISVVGKKPDAWRLPMNRAETTGSDPMKHEFDELVSGLLFSASTEVFAVHVETRTTPLGKPDVNFLAAGDLTCRYPRRPGHEPA